MYYYHAQIDPEEIETNAEIFGPVQRTVAQFSI